MHQIQDVPTPGRARRRSGIAYVSAVLWIASISFAHPQQPVVAVPPFHEYTLPQMALTLPMADETATTLHVRAVTSPNYINAETASLLDGSATASLALPDAPSAQANSDTVGKRSVEQQAPVGPDGKPIRPQTGRIFGIFPNFVAVSGGTKPKPAGWKTDFSLANKQAYDYSSFGFLLISSGLAYAQDSHPSLNTVNGGDSIFWAYLWRGFLDKTDGTYQGTFFFPALLHEDTRYYALGTGPVKKRLLHAVASVVVAHNYDQKPIFNLAGQLGRAGAQAVSTTYYPAGSESFGVLAEKFAYSNMRNVIYAVVREFSPDAQARVHLGHRSETP